MMRDGVLEMRWSVGDDVDEMSWSVGDVLRWRCLGDEHDMGCLLSQY